MTESNTLPKYLEYFSEWKIALQEAQSWLDMKAVCIIGSALSGILREMLDADTISPIMALDFINEVSEETQDKFNIYLN